MPKRFSLVPVLDLKAGQVVHARAGARERYQPIRTPLAASSAPEAVLAGLLALAPFRRIYIADLDAIEGGGDNFPIIAALKAKWPALEIWLDAGGRGARAPGIEPVVGSESLASAELPPGSKVLSLDFRADAFVGPAALAERPALWPEHVIVMTLARVGTALGPDLARLGAVKARAGARHVWAAGGVRGIEDVARLAAMELAGVLIATALHDGRLPPQALLAYG